MGTAITTNDAEKERKLGGTDVFLLASCRITRRQ